MYQTGNHYKTLTRGQRLLCIITATTATALYTMFCRRYIPLNVLTFIVSIVGAGCTFELALRAARAFLGEEP